MTSKQRTGIKLRRNIHFHIPWILSDDDDIADAVDRGKMSTIKDIELLGKECVLSLTIEAIDDLPDEDRHITDEDSDKESESEALAGESKHYKKHAVLLIMQVFIQV